MKRKRVAASKEDIPQTIDGIKDKLQLSIRKGDPRILADLLMELCGMDDDSNPPTKSFADLLTQAAAVVSDTANEGILHKIEKNEMDYLHRAQYFGAVRVPMDCIGLIANYLESSEKLQLATLNKSWKLLSTSHYLWQVLDPFPAKSFSNHAKFRQYLNKNKQKFLGSKILQVPRIPTSNKLFQDIFKAMPLLNSISLYNVIGTGSVKHCISNAPNPSKLMQLSVGLSTRVHPMEISSALKCVVNLRAFSLAFWQDFRVDAGSFAMLGDSLSCLKRLKYFSLSQSVLYPESYFIEDDEMTDAVFEKLASNLSGLRDIYLGSFHAVTSATWKSFASHCQQLRSFSMEDCGVIITGEDIRILTSMSNGALKYLTLFPRALVDEQISLPGPEEQYITPDALDAILICRETQPKLTIFLKSQYADATMPISPKYGDYSGQSSATEHDENQCSGISVNNSAEGNRDYERLVSLGHIAAFRMYDDIQLLPLSYFEDSIFN